ncbi:cupin domain-containing protein [Minwuia sp.]|uniref:cupin domain-containing protein n=1 Tax=Minwuia sp. TaxID=2493630 RepID=UPI003A938E25
MTDGPRRMSDVAYALRTGAQRIEPHGTAGFWPRLAAGEIAQDALVTCSRVDGDFPHWEMHPNGDELFILHSGVIDIVLEQSGGERTVRLSAGETFVIPKGIWHRACVVEPGDLTFLTFGEGTRHRPI